MPKLWVKDSGAWKQVQRLWVKQGGAWKSVVSGSIADTGASKLFYPDISGTETYSIPGTYSFSVPAGVTAILAKTVGGGGGGQAGNGNYSGTGGAGAGGAAGATVDQVINVLPGSTLSIVVGAGGTGGAAFVQGGTSPDGQPGGNGSASFITGFANTVANGGAGGHKAANQGNFPAGNFAGAWDGDGGSWWYGYQGANSTLGTGGSGGQIYTNGSNGALGSGGGGGSASNFSPNDWSSSGGNGGGGYVSITPYVNVPLTGVQSLAGCYSAQGGFSVDYFEGRTILTMGAWPTDPPNCQTCDWRWLQFGGRGGSGLSDSSSSNNFRRNNNVRPYWTNQWELDLDSIAVGQTVYTRSPNWPYTNVSYTYAVTKTSARSIRIVPYPSSWGTGDTGTSISVYYWWRNVVLLGGGNPDEGVLGNINLSW